MLSTFSIIFRLFLSVFLGGIIGLERERSNQPAGFRTHIILCVGSTLMMMISLYMAENFKGEGGGPDPTRIAAQVVSGIGFLGAGAILRMGVSIKGLTTAASLWTTGGIGLAVGCGFYGGAFLSVIIILAALTVFGNIQKIFLSGKLDRTLNITAEDKKGIIGTIEAVLGKFGVEIKNIQVSRSAVKGVIEINAIVTMPSSTNISSFVNKLTHLPEIVEVELL